MEVWLIRNRFYPHITSRKILSQVYNLLNIYSAECTILPIILFFCTCIIHVENEVIKLFTWDREYDPVTLVIHLM